MGSVVFTMPATSLPSSGACRPNQPIRVGELEIRPLTIPLLMLMERIGSGLVTAGKVVSDADARETVFIFTRPVLESLDLFHRGRMALREAAETFCLRIPPNAFAEIGRAINAQAELWINPLPAAPQLRQIISASIMDAASPIEVEKALRMANARVLTPTADPLRLQDMAIVIFALCTPRTVIEAVIEGRDAFEKAVFSFAERLNEPGCTTDASGLTATIRLTAWIQKLRNHKST